MELKYHQEECIENIANNFINNKKGLIKMFCGSGKSMIIYNCLLEYGKKISVIVVPSINLITQFNNDYIFNDKTIEYNNKYFLKKYITITICSKNELPTQDKVDNLFTTDEYEIFNFLTKIEDKVIIITYQSLPKLINIVKEHNIIIDLICFDEAHHILGENISNVLFRNDKDKCFIDSYVDKTLFFTATPKNTLDFKMYNNITELHINNIDYTLITDENVNVNDTLITDENVNVNDTLICGPLIYEYSHLSGVNDNVLNDYNVRIELFSKNQAFNIFETISRAILETGNNRVLTFHSRSSTKSEKGSDVISFSNNDNQKIFIKAFNKILLNEFSQLKGKYKNITFKGITAKTKNKTNILNEFDSTNNNEIYVLSSCKTIGEGVDTKNANMVCFIDPKQSYIEIIQNIGRICRKNKNTTNLATILIPCYVDIEKYIGCNEDNNKIDAIIRSEMSKQGDFNSILSVLSALRQEDPYIFELCLKYPNLYTNDEFKRSFKKNNLILDDTEYDINELFNNYNDVYNEDMIITDNFKNLSEKLNKNIKIYCKQINEKNIRINNKFDIDECFVKTENDKYIKVLGQKEKNKKITKPNRNIKPFIHVDEKIKVLWGIDSKIENNILTDKIFGCFIKSSVIANTKELWIEMYNNIINDDVKNMSNYSSWIKMNKMKYKENVGLMSDLEIRKLWEIIKDDTKKGIFFNSNKEVWFMKLQEFKCYCLSNEFTHNDESTLLSKQSRMYQWIDLNMKNYRNSKSLMVDQNIKTEWEKFMNDPVYSKLFKSYINKSYINKAYNNNIPSQEYLKRCNEYEEKYYSNLNVYTNFYENKIKLTDLEIKKIKDWDLRNISYYRTKKLHMSNEKIRTEYSIFAIKYKNIDQYSAYRYEKCGQKKLEKYNN